MASSIRGRRSRLNWSEMARIRSILASWLSGSTWRMSRQTLSASSGSPSRRYRSAFFIASGIESFERSRKAKDEGMLGNLGRATAGRRNAESPKGHDQPDWDNDGENISTSGGPVAL